MKGTSSGDTPKHCLSHLPHLDAPQAANPAASQRPKAPNPTLQSGRTAPLCCPWPRHSQNSSMLCHCLAALAVSEALKSRASGLGAPGLSLIKFTMQGSPGAERPSKMGSAASSDHRNTEETSTHTPNETKLLITLASGCSSAVSPPPLQTRKTSSRWQSLGATALAFAGPRGSA